MSEPEMPNYSETIRQQAERANTSNELQLAYGEHTALAHLAIFSTALAVNGVLLGVAKNGKDLSIKVNNPNNRRNRFSTKPKKDDFGYTFEATSRVETPFVHAKIITNTQTKYDTFSYIPTNVNRTLLKTNQAVRSTELVLESTPSGLGLEKLQVGVWATHTSNGRKHATVETTKKVFNEEEFNPLFALIEDITEQPDNEYLSSVGTLTKKTLVTITDDPERHFNFHAALGLHDGHMSMARGNFNAIMQSNGIPYRTNL